MVHPDRILDERGIENLPAVEAVYGLTEGLSSRMVGKFIGAALEKTPGMPEWQDPAWLDRNALPDFRQAAANVGNAVQGLGRQAKAGQVLRLALLTGADWDVGIP